MDRFTNSSRQKPMSKIRIYFEAKPENRIYLILAAKKHFGPDATIKTADQSRFVLNVPSDQVSRQKISDYCKIVTTEYPDVADGLKYQILGVT
jgi:hypothetical protein